MRLVLFRPRFPKLSPGPIFFDNASSSGYEASLSTYNWSHTCTGTNRGLLVFVSIFVSGSVSSVTYNSVSMTFVRSDSNGVYRQEVWKLENPSSGSNTVTVNLSASLTSIANASSWTGVDQTNIIEADNGANGSGTDATVSVTTISNNTYVVDGVSTADTSISEVSPQRKRINNTGALGTGSQSDKGVISPAGATTMTWTNIGALQSWAHSAVALNPFVPVTPTTFLKDVIMRGLIPWKRS